MVCKAKGHLEFNLARGWEARRKAFCTPIISKKKIMLWKMWADCWVWKGSWQRRGQEQPRYSITPTPQSFLEDPRSWDYRKSLEQEDLPLLEENRVRKHLNKLGICKNLGPNRMQPLSTEGAHWCHCKADLNYLKDHGIWGRFLRTEKKQNITLIFKTCKKIWGTTCWSAASVPMKKQVVLETIFKCIKKVIGEMESKIMLELNSFPQFPQLMYEKRVVEFVYLNFIKAFNTVTHKILTGKMIGRQRDELKTGWTAGFQGFWSAPGSPAGDQSQVV